ncbi:Predicted transcriptional regulator with C-terminal CBS domains [Halopelagius inordinatus]|uniref:Predicted transcriptional regulator with C-terminal CBS domains n=1 Tax=Halopelagius inordinatus TaxID=553467 RepID=A0A1I2UNL8_9EURY|nr:CBS domain-containing protein [Halopelagius inordinatus]SFG77217.1 Predicted transcriptional regulator with C-terminal CBS domains [Halopelagius inordinatus]
MELPTPQDLRERRKALDLTQSSLAEMAGVSQPLIARIEGGDVDPRLSTLRRIVNALDEAEGSVVRARDLMNESVVSISPDDSVRHARDRMLDEGFSQLPVIRDGSPVGIISNSDIRHVQEENVGELPVAEVMRESYTTVEPTATLEEIDAYLDHNAAILVVEGGQTVGIVTEADVAAHL